MLFINKTNEQDKSAGIYRIYNTANGRKYIGSTINIRQRYREHRRKLRNKSHHNIFLQNDYNKCGENAFIFEFIEFIDDKKSLLKYEQVWIDKFFDNQNSCYNLSPNANNTLGFKHSEQTKQKLKKIRTGVKHTNKSKKKIGEAAKKLWSKKEFHEKMCKKHKKRWSCQDFKEKMSGKNHPNYGKKQSEETKKKRSKALSGANNPMWGKAGSKNPFFGKKHTKNTRIKMSKIKKGVKRPEYEKPILQFDKSGNFIKEWQSAMKAKEALKISNASICSCCKGKLKSAGGYIWKYKPTELL